jgi:Mg-chelatase subunit ChlD
VAHGSAGCEPGGASLDVVASPDIAPAVAAVVRAGEDLQAPRGCPQFRVRAGSETDVLGGLAGGASSPPDVWIPSSVMWVERARRLVSPVRQASIASSPLVLAVPAAVADRLRPGENPPGWDDVVAAGYAGTVVLNLSEPEASPATVSLVGAVEAELEGRPDGRAMLAGLLLGARMVSATADGSAALSALHSLPTGAVPVTEQAVWAAEGKISGTPLVAVYPPGGTTPFNYPYTVLTTDGAARAAAARLLTALEGPSGQDRLRQAGFRGRDGTGPGSTAARGVDAARPSRVAVPGPAAVEEVRQAIAVVRQDTRLLAVLDVSGSMAAPAPGPEGTTRLDLATRAAAAGLQLFPDTAEVGLWSFSEDVTPTSDHTELVPVAPLTAPTAGGAAALAEALVGLQPVPDGGTALYDTTLAAVRAVRAVWDPDRVNAVLLLSDGEDTDDHGIGLDALLATLQTEQADGRPVPVITIAYGPDAGAKALAAIADATHGASYRTTDPDRIRDIFLDAVGQRACRPLCTTSPGS